MDLDALLEMAMNSEVDIDNSAYWEPAVPKEKAFGKKKVTCMICGKELSTLTVHLKRVHDTTAKEYRDRFDVPPDQPLTSKAFTAKRRRIAIEKGLDKNLLRGKKKV